MGLEGIWHPLDRTEIEAEAYFLRLNANSFRDLAPIRPVSIASFKKCSPVQTLDGHPRVQLVGAPPHLDAFTHG